MTERARVALVSARAARDLDDDLDPLVEALDARGLVCDVVDWDDPAIDWAGFDVAVLRSTWDYTMRLAEFLAWLDRADACARLLNPAAVVRWSADKHYLDTLRHAGIPIVPSAFAEPGDDPGEVLEAFLAMHASSPEIVVKPAVGAGSRDARRHAREDRTAAHAHLQFLLADHRSAVLQPYLDRVDRQGETALIHFDGRFSHAVRKGPLLRAGEQATRALFAAEHITARDAPQDERELAERTLAAIPFAGPLAYARIDLIRDEADTPCVLELELAEPSLFFATAPGSAARFAETIAERIASA